ncbi:HNH endonuclease [Paenibacillus timonensis]|uniref:HNH endonuclease n=1 Tax=Paenibacillus timonensis TaxID=225915 RepID=UPI0022DFC4A2|nr:HNH endonuclease [Paenibacillus timonensis]
MFILLSQRIDTKSSYEDIPFSLYHYPKKYKNQINTGDIFIYYQGDRYKRNNRYYFGFGVIGKIDISEDGEEYYAQILEGVPFPNKVPIYKPDGGFYESINYSEIRKKLNPPWQNSVRKISETAFTEILKAANVININLYQDISDIETKQDPIELLKSFNEKYQNLSPQKRDRVVSAHIDRGKSVTDALKKILGHNCQICGIDGFEKKNSDRYIEAHHLTQLSLNQIESLCSENVILVCPNCHRELHYGKTIIIEDKGTQIYIKLGNKESLINKNSIKYLEQMLLSKKHLL